MRSMYREVSATAEKESSTYIEKSLHHDAKPVIQICRCKISEQLMKAVEGDRVEHPTGLMSDGFGEMGFSGSGGSEKKDSLTALNEATRCKRSDEFSIDRRIESEVEALDGVFNTKTGLVDKARDLTSSSHFQFIGEQHGEKLFIGQIVLVSFQEPGIEMVEDAGEFEIADL